MAASQREIILGVGGGIAAYKACDLLRRLQDAGYLVTVVPTPSSLNFVGKATWEALSGREVTTSVFESVNQVRHVSLADRAEAIVIAPATADLIARIAAGRADDLLTNIILASRAPILIVPAMHTAMWLNEATQANVGKLRQRGIEVMEPSDGPLTSGDIGKGRFPTTEEIMDRFEATTIVKKDLAGVRVLVTAGGTREAIDPVRYIGNRSTGIQGVAIAEAARARGAEVTLLIANSELPTHPAVKRVDVENVSQLQAALTSAFTATDMLFMAAAVSDVRPEFSSDKKIKKSELSSITLVANPDLLSELKAKANKQVIVAFAAETSEDSLTLAQEKMSRKGAHLIYLNDVSQGAIFGSPKTSGAIIESDGRVTQVDKVTKNTLAHQLINHALKYLNKLG